MSDLGILISGGATGAGLMETLHEHLLIGIPLLVVGTGSMIVSQILWWRKRRQVRRSHQVDWSTWPGVMNDESDDPNRI